MQRVLLAMVLVGATSCNRPAATEGRLAAIEANLKSLRPLSGRERQTPYTAYFQQGDLQLIEEQPKEGTAVHNRYYFHHGELFYYRQLHQGQVTRQFVIDKNGLVKNTYPAPFPKDDLQQVSAHADALKNAALTRAGQVFDFPIMRNR